MYIYSYPPKDLGNYSTQIDGDTVEATPPNCTICTHPTLLCIMECFCIICYMYAYSQFVESTLQQIIQKHSIMHSSVGCVQIVQFVTASRDPVHARYEGNVSRLDSL